MTCGGSFSRKAGALSNLGAGRPCSSGLSWLTTSSEGSQQFSFTHQAAQHQALRPERATKSKDTKNFEFLPFAIRIVLFCRCEVSFSSFFLLLGPAVVTAAETPCPAHNAYIPRIPDRGSPVKASLPDPKQDLPAPHISRYPALRFTQPWS